MVLFWKTFFFNLWRSFVATLFLNNPPYPLFTIIHPEIPEWRLSNCNAIVLRIRIRPCSASHSDINHHHHPVLVCKQQYIGIVILSRWYIAQSHWQAVTQTVLFCFPSTEDNRRATTANSLRDWDWYIRTSRLLCIEEWLPLTHQWTMKYRSDDLLPTLFREFSF